VTLGPDLFLDPVTGDLDVSQATARMVTDVRQAVQIRLRFFAAEWFLDVRKGVPYYAQILVKAPNLDHVGSIFRRTIVNTPGVGELLAFALDYDEQRRTLNVTWRADTDQGEISDTTAVIL